MRSSDWHFYLHDANYNVVALMELDSGTRDVVERYHYSPYGEVSKFDASRTSRSSSSYDNELLYTGRRLDPEAELYQYRHRYYHADLGRFTGRIR